MGKQELIAVLGKALGLFCYMVIEQRLGRSGHGSVLDLARKTLVEGQKSKKEEQNPWGDTHE